MPNVAATLSLNVPAITALCKGDAGASILHGYGAPNLNVGRNEDFYLDNLSYIIYGPKTTNYGWGEGTVLSNSISAAIWNSVYSTTKSLSNNWQTAYSLVSAGTLSTTFNTVSSLSSSWIGGNSAYTTLYAASANWQSTFNTVSSLSGNWQNAINASSTYTTVYEASAGWQSTYSTVTGFSAQWSAGGNTVAISVVQNNSGDWNSTHTQVYNLSANWNKAYNQVKSISGNWDQAYQSLSLDIQPVTGNWNSVYSQVYKLSSAWSSVFTTVCGQSATWNSQSYFNPEKGNSAWTTVNVTSADWVSTHEQTYGLSGQWTAAYQAMNTGETFNGTGSAAWQAAWDGLVMYQPWLLTTHNTISGLSGAWQSTAGGALSASDRGSTITMGLCTLRAATPTSFQTVSATYTSPTSRIFLTTQNPGGTVGSLYVSRIDPGVGFIVRSTSTTDTSLFAWHIVVGSTYTAG